MLQYKSFIVHHSLGLLIRPQLFSPRGEPSFQRSLSVDSRTKVSPNKYFPQMCLLTELANGIGYDNNRFSPFARDEKATEVSLNYAARAMRNS